MNEEKNIFQKMLAISNELKVVKKSLNVGVGSSGSYKAVGEADVIAAVKALEVKHGIYSYPYSRDVIESRDISDSKIMYKKNGEEYNKETITHFMRIRTIYRFVNVDKPDEFIDMTTFADGVDTGDKACGKAETYCDKYALMKAYKMITGDDPDQWKSYSPEDDEVDPKTGEVIEPVTEATEKRLKELGIEKEKVAAYCKKDVQYVSESDCLNAIELKEKAIQKKLAKKAMEDAVSNAPAPSEVK